MKPRTSISRAGGSGVAVPKPATAPPGAHPPPGKLPTKPAEVAKKPVAAAGSESAVRDEPPAPSPRSRAAPQDMATPGLQGSVAGIAAAAAGGVGQSTERSTLGLLQGLGTPGAGVGGLLRTGDLHGLLQSPQGGGMTPANLQGLLQAAQAGGMTPQGLLQSAQAGGNFQDLLQSAQASGNLQGLLQAAQSGGMTPQGLMQSVQAGGLQGLLQQTTQSVGGAPGNLLAALQSAAAQGGGQLQGLQQAAQGGVAGAPGNLLAALQSAAAQGGGQLQQAAQGGVAGASGNLLAALQSAAAQGGGQLQGLQQAAQGGVAGASGNLLAALQSAAAQGGGQVQGLQQAAQGGVAGLQGLLNSAQGGGLQGLFGSLQGGGDLQQSLLRLGGGLASAFPASAAATPAAAEHHHRNHNDLWARLEGGGASSLMGPGGVVSPSMVHAGGRAAGGGPAPEPRAWPADAKPRVSPQKRIEIFVEMARAYTWMHGRAHNAAAQNAVIITTTVTLLSYVSGGLALGSAGTYYADQLTLLAAVLSLLVGAIAAIAKLKYFNFEAVAQQHASALRQWNKFISTCSTALAVPEEKQDQPLVDLLADLFPLWGELSSDSQELLPMWVRRECAEAFRRDNPRYMLPAICKDSKKGAARVAPAPWQHEQQHPAHAAPAPAHEQQHRAHAAPAPAHEQQRPAPVTAAAVAAPVASVAGDARPQASPRAAAGGQASASIPQ